MDQDSLWTKDFILDVIINFLLYLICYQLMVWAAVFSIAQWQASVSQAGLASGLFIIGALISRLITGHAIDLAGRKRTLVLGAVLYTLVLPIYSLAFSLPLFFIIRTLHGIAYGVVSTAASTVICALVPVRRRGEGIGYYALGNTLASALGPFLGITLTSGGHYFCNVYACAALAFLALFLLLLLHTPESSHTAEEKAVLLNMNLKGFISSKALPISVISLLCGICYSTVISFIGAYTASLGMAWTGSLLFFCYAAASLVSRPLIGRFLDSHGSNMVMYPALAMLIVCMIIVGIAAAPWYFAVAGMLLALSYGVIPSAGQALAIQHVPEEQIGVAMSTFFIFLDAGVGVGSYFLGAFVPLYGFSGVYYGAAVVACAAVGLYYLLIGRTGRFSSAQMRRH